MENISPLLLAAGFSMSLIASTLKVEAQNPDLAIQIEGPYEGSKDFPGPFYIKVYVNFIAISSSNDWTSSYDLDELARNSRQRLNQAFNPHNIYFVGPGGGL